MNTGLKLVDTRRLWLNVAEVKELPRDMYHYKTGAFIPEEERLQLLKQWPHVNEGQAFWAFEEPPQEFNDKYRFSEEGPPHKTTIDLLERR